jgi:hypothetical protein
MEVGEGDNMSIRELDQQLGRGEVVLTIWRPVVNTCFTFSDIYCEKFFNAFHVIVIKRAVISLT